MKADYLPKDRDGRLFRLVEECGEVLQAIGKAGRFGMENRYPAEGDSNAAKLLAELDDLQHAMEAVREDLELFGAGLGKSEPSP